jgi:FKBP-type peptidyl-prolyl cis-trans isomerase FkpA
MICKIPYLFLLVFLLCQSCTPEPKKEEQAPINKEALKKQFVEANQLLAQKENDDMDAYARNHKMDLVNTDLGLRYFVYAPSAKGDSIKDKMEIALDFTISLLDGTECYSTKETGPKKLMVGMEEAESGLHKGVKFLKKGDKAIILIPSHLAHGLLGDMDKIPPQMPIVYDIHILN